MTEPIEAGMGGEATVPILILCPHHRGGRFSGPRGGVAEVWTQAARGNTPRKTSVRVTTPVNRLSWVTAASWRLLRRMEASASCNGVVEGSVRACWISGWIGAEGSIVRVSRTWTTPGTLSGLSLIHI